MASSTASAVSHYSVAILDAYKRRNNRILARKRAAVAELEEIYAAPEPVTVEVAKKAIKKAAPSVTQSEINMAVQVARMQNDAAKVTIAEVKTVLQRMMEELDDEAALLALL